MPMKARTKDVSIAARITARQAQQLDEVQAAVPPLKSRSAAIGRLIDLSIRDDFRAADAAEGKEVHLDAASVELLRESLRLRTNSYNELAKQIRAVGHNLNQLVKLGQQAKIYGKSGAVVLDAVENIARQHRDVIANELHRLAMQDAHVEAVVQACQRH